MTREEALQILRYQMQTHIASEVDLHIAMGMAIEALSRQAEIIYCKECVYYDPPHIEDKGKRLEYKDMPKDAFDELGTGLVHSGYGINVGGRCLRDYNAGYVEDKRVFVGEENYCGRAIKGGEQSE